LPVIAYRLETRGSGATALGSVITLFLNQTDPTTGSRPLLTLAVLNASLCIYALVMR
jgi:hypothetical protein